MLNRINFIAIIFLILISFKLGLAEDHEIKGIVLHNQTHKPLAFANIYIAGTNKGTITKEDGSFSLTVPSNSEIFISYIGFRTEILNSAEFTGKKKTIYLIPTDILMQEVSVYSSQSSTSREVSGSNLSLKSDKIKKISSAMPDVLRSIQTLPGISSNNGFQAEFNVRGGNKDENLIQVNGSEVYEPYHIKAIPNASVGIFNVDLIQKVNIITGGFSAQYGDRLSSVANIYYREGNRSRYSGAGNLSMAFVEGYFEGPLLNKGSFILGIRKTYMEYLLRMFKFEDDNISNVEPSFYDIQGVLSYDFSPKNKLKLTIINSTDNFKYLPDNLNSTNSYTGDFNGKPASFIEKTKKFQSSVGKYYSSFADLQSTNFLGKSAFLRTNISYYNQENSEAKNTVSSFSRIIDSNNSYFENENKNEEYRQSLKVNTLEIKSLLDYQITPFWELKAGLGYKDLTYLQHISLTKYLNNSMNTKNYPDTTSYNGQQGGQNAGNESLDAYSFKSLGFIENIYQVTSKFIVNLGGRADYFGMNRDLTFSPRLSLAFYPSQGTILRAAWGHYYQSPLYSQLAYSEPSDSNTQSQKAIHYILGIEQNFSLSSSNISLIKLKVDAYYKKYSDLISSYKSHFDRLYYSLKNDALGFAKGIDVYVLLSIPRFYSWISYSYLIAKEDNINDNTGYYPRNSDQRSTLAWVADIALGKGWELTSRFYFGSGYPYTPKTAVYRTTQLRWAWHTEEKNSKYLPAYRRLDFRVSKNFNFASYKLKTFIDLSNALNFKNISGYDYNFDKDGKPKINEVVLWPFLPSFGIKLEF